MAKTNVSKNEAVFKISLPVGKYRVRTRHPNYAVELEDVVVVSEHILKMDVVLHRIKEREQASVSVQGKECFLNDKTCIDYYMIHFQNFRIRNQRTKVGG